MSYSSSLIKLNESFLNNYIPSILIRDTGIINLNCEFQMKSKEGRIYIGIGAIIENTMTGKILLLRRSGKVEFAKNIWDDVGGRMRPFETPEETLRREVYEETGITELEIIKPIDVSNYYRGERTAENQMIVITYWCKTASLNVKLSAEHDQYKWLSPEEALALINDFSLKNNVKKFIQEK